MRKTLSNKRKALTPTRELIAPKAKVEPISINDMILTVEGYDKCFFNRLKYKGCPSLNYKWKVIRADELVDMNRDNFIRDLYHLLTQNPNVTMRNHFQNVLRYFEWFDAEERMSIDNDYLHIDLIDAYMSWAVQQIKLGMLTKSNFGRRKLTISWLLRQKGRIQEAKQLPSISGEGVPINPTKAFDLEAELKPTVRALFKAYKLLVKHYNEGTIPEVHPLWDEALVSAEAKRRGYQGHALRNYRGAFRKAITDSHPNNPIIKIAMLICYMFTGINSTPLAKLKISDVYFKEVQGGKYILDSTKGRAEYQHQDNSLGFSKYAKEFIEGWLVIATKISNGDTNSPLFPYFTLYKGVKSFAEVQERPQKSVNRLLDKLGLPKVTPSRFRKTKMDILFRVTESVYLVAMSANNSVKVVARTYVNGTKAEHINNLGASMDAKFAIAKGERISSAIQAAKFKFGDVLDDYEYQELRIGKDRTHESRTPTGVRCNDNTKGAAQVINKILERSGIKLSNDETVCTSFLDCFECEHHVLVADVIDIWLMLSFKETLQQLQQTPAVNSMPENKYIKLFNTIESVLERFKDKSKENYNKAEIKLKEASHPLYSNVYSLNDLLEVFV